MALWILMLLLPPEVFTALFVGWMAGYMSCLAIGVHLARSAARRKPTAAIDQTGVET